MTGNRIAIPQNPQLVGRSGLRPSAEVTRWLYLVGVLVVISVLAFVYLAQASYVVRQVNTLRTLESRIHESKRQNNELRLQIALLEGSDLIRAQARAAGFGEPTRVEYVQVFVDESGTSRSDPRNAISGGTSAVGPSWPSGWWSAVLQQFEDWIFGGIVRADQAAP